MAESFLKGIEEQLKCPICSDYFNKPKILPRCGHVACKDCLKSLLSTSADESRTVNCPECSEVIGESKGTVGKLKTNLILQNLAERFHHFTGTSGQTDKRKIAIAFCNVHPEEKLHLYCNSCNAFVCQLCFLECHNQKQHHIVCAANRGKEQKSEKQIACDDRFTNAESFAKAVKQELKCPICFDYFIEPKILPRCGHVACEGCLKGLLSTSTDKSRTKKCPECNKAIVGNWKTNWRLQNLAERCRRDTETNGETDKYNIPVDLCRVHSKENVHLYCVACNALACALCFLECHSGEQHQIVGVANMWKEQKSEIEIVLKGQRAKVDQSKETVGKLKEQMQLVKESLKSEEESVDEFAKQRIYEIKKEGLMLHTKLKKAYSPTIKELQRQLAKTEEEIEKAECVHERIQHSVTKLPNSKYVSQHKTFLDQLKSLEVHQMTLTPRHNITLPVAKFVCEQSDNSKIGKVVSVMEHARGKANADSVLTYLIYGMGIIMQGMFLFGNAVFMTLLTCWNWPVNPCLRFLSKCFVRLTALLISQLLTIVRAILNYRWGHR